MQEALGVASDAVKRAGKILIKGINEEKYTQAKSHKYDPVTIFDRRSEKVLTDIIRNSFPDHGIVSEEGTRIEGKSPYTWLIDPLDGTNNFLRGIPHFSVSLALTRDGESFVGCTYDPVRNELFTAIRGEGATLNGRSIRVSAQASLEGCVVGVGFSSRPELAMFTQSRLAQVIPHVRAIRTYGSACLDLAYVASGRIDVAWYLSLWPWDIAAGKLLIAEAGGASSNLLGGKIVNSQDGIVATNGAIHAETLSIVSP
jgi:myo-inositol-1(or 4)-monophosphatase